MTQDMNEQLVCVVGESATGKSASLAGIRDQENWWYLNCESGKRLPFKNSFKTFTITDPLQIYEAFDAAKNKPEVRGLAIDTLTFLMEMYETQYVIGSDNTMAGWSDYQQYFKKLMQNYVAPSDKSILFFAHTREDYDEKKMEMKTSIPVKGALKGNGLEAFFSTIVATKKVELEKLENYQNSMLNITEDDELLGYKHVFQTRLTKETVGERIRSPIGMFSKNETYIDNDCQVLLDHLKEFYGN